jgi:sugar (pentulose or hexulose) kinase
MQWERRNIRFRRTIVDKYLLGIDIGTSGVKSVLFSAAGDQVARSYRGYPIVSGNPGACEQDAGKWWRAVVETVREICPSPIARHVKALSLSTQGGTVVPVDHDGNALAPAIVWSDSRAKTQRVAFERLFGDSHMYAKSGWHLTDGLPALQIARIRDEEPAVFDKAAKFLTVPGYIAMKLTGEPAVDLSNAGIDQLIDIREGRYDSSLLDFAGIDERQLAPIVKSGSVLGHLCRDASDRLGLPLSTMVVSGAHDQYAAALGAGIFGQGDILVGTGTAWAVCALTDNLDFSSGFSLSSSAVEGKWGALVSLPHGGICLDWLRDKVFGSSVSYEKIDTEAARRPPGADGLFFYPYFTGSVFPCMDNCSKATFVGLDLRHDRYHMARAVMEGVSFQVGWMSEGFREAGEMQRVVFSGGASRSKLWTQLSADIFGCPLHVPLMPDLGCIGAAVMAGVGSGIYSSVRQGYECLSAPERVFEPSSAAADRYGQLSGCYRSRCEDLGRMYGSPR